MRPTKIDCRSETRFQRREDAERLCVVLAETDEDGWTYRVEERAGTSGPVHYVLVVQDADGHDLGTL